jgi:hypothetical protein
MILKTLGTNAPKVFIFYIATNAIMTIAPQRTIIKS